MRLVFFTEVGDDTKTERPSLTTQLVETLHAAAVAMRELYDTAIIRALQDVIPDLPATSPFAGQPLEWLDLRPLLVSALEFTKQKVAVSPPLTPDSDYYVVGMHKDLSFLQAAITNPPFVAASPATPSVASTTRTAEAIAKRQIDAGGQNQGSAKRLKACSTTASAAQETRSKADK